MMKPLDKTPPLPSAQIRLHPFGQHPPNAGPRVYLFFDVLDELIYHARYRNQTAATLLLGGYYTGPDGPYLEIQGFTEATYLEEPSEWKAHLNDRYPILQRKFQQQSTQLILGWSMANRGSKALLDTPALLTHTTFFDAPHHIMLAIDPGYERVALYQRSNETQALVNIGFQVLSRLPEADPEGPNTDENQAPKTSAATHESVFSEIRAADKKSPASEKPVANDENLAETQATAKTKPAPSEATPPPKEQEPAAVAAPKTEEQTLAEVPNRKPSESSIDASSSMPWPEEDEDDALHSLIAEALSETHSDSDFFSNPEPSQPVEPDANVLKLDEAGSLDWPESDALDPALLSQDEELIRVLAEALNTKKDRSNQGEALEIKASEEPDPQDNST